ncbi:MAG: hypothetical protein V4447_03695 [Pseudomonadota bacterium]
MKNVLCWLSGSPSQSYRLSKCYKRLDSPEFIEVAAALDIPPSDFIVEYQRRVATLKML